MAGSSYGGGYADLYSNPTTNPRGITPGANVPGVDYTPYSDYLASHGAATSAANIQDVYRDYTNTYDWSGGSGGAAPSMYPPGGPGGGGGGGYGYGGGGGGGGGGPSGITQAQFDWATGLLGQGQTDPLTANRLNLPGYRSKFHPQMYNQMLRKFNRGVNVDRRTANKSYDQLGNFIRNNYTNAYRNPNARAASINQAPGMNQAQMARMAQNQGVDPSVVGEQMQGASAADRAFQNLWGVLGTNEAQNQRNRITGVKESRGDTMNALRVAALQGRTGIGMQKASAKDEWRTRVEDARNQLRQQEAMANWQRQNQVSDTNFTTSSEYRNNVIQALLGMLPSLAEGVDLPGDLGDLLGIPENGPQGQGGRNERFGQGGRPRGAPRGRVGTPERGPQGKGRKGKKK